MDWPWDRLVAGLELIRNQCPQSIHHLAAVTTALEARPALASRRLLADLSALSIDIETNPADGDRSRTRLYLEPDAQRPDVLEFEGRLLPNDLDLVPRLARSGDA